MPQPMLELNHVSFRVKTLAQPIVDQLSLKVNSNDFLVVLGSNGSGKSSLLKLINRHYIASDGQIRFLGQAIEQQSLSKYRKKVITISQAASNNLCTSMTVIENARLYHSAIENTERFQADAFAEHIRQFNPKLLRYLHKRVQNLSGGEQQMLVLGLMLMRKPTLLLLDEHTSALDPKTSDQIMQLTYDVTQQYKITCVMTTHHLDHALRYGNRLIAIANGKIQQQFDQQQKQQLSREQLLSVCYDV